jgi:aspartate/methionine/tyrosine aminotransferase
MLAKTWICSVPLSWFNSTFDWFRITLLEEDVEKFNTIIQIIADFINNWWK